MCPQGEMRTDQGELREKPSQVNAEGLKLGSKRW